jgi:antitoxin MazE
METRMQKWGNSLALRIPKLVCEEAGLKYNSRVRVTMNKRQIIIEAVPQDALSLEDLLDGITDDNVHGKIDGGGPVGAEIW